ncbi:MAG: chromosome segregation protein SMC [Ferruginibacter sp.]|nr:chromosome segregation protein SMC [Cytophagales bacterium]
MAEQNLDTPEKQGDKKVLLWIFILILGILNVVLIYLNFREKNEKEVVQTQKQELQTNFDATAQKLDSISNELNLRITEVKRLGGDVTSLMQVKEQLEADKVSIRGANRRSAAEYDEKIRTYETLLVERDKEINKLKGLNEQLYTENTTLKTQKNQLNDSISNIQQEKTKLSEQVAIASVLTVENLAINALNDRGKERDGGEYKARQLEKIKVVFNLGENSVAQVGGKEIMMRLTEPDGATLYDTGMGGGTFTVGGQETYYTAKQDILFDNTRQPIVFTYSKGTPYKQGKHTVELYADGYKIGTGSFVVK